MCPPFDERAGWSLNSQVALRPESFGALAYHFGTRRLSFLKHPLLVQTVQGLAGFASAEEAITAAGVSDGQRPAITRALETLAETDMIVRRAS
jgi:putative mycofactocin binding protein MftB